MPRPYDLRVPVGQRIVTQPLGTETVLLAAKQATED
jgi:hypothetical protein